MDDGRSFRVSIFFVCEYTWCILAWYASVSLPDESWSGYVRDDELAWNTTAQYTELWTTSHDADEVCIG